MTRTTSTVLTIALTAVFVFALSLAALAAPYAPADAPPDTSYGPLRGVVEHAGQPAVVNPATAPQPAVVPPAVPATDDAGTVILVAAIVTGLFLAAIGGYAAVTARQRRAAHA